MRMKACAIFAALMIAAGSAAAGVLDLGVLKISDPVAYAAPEGASTKLRMKLANIGPSPVFIVRLTTPVARVAEFRLNAGAEGEQPLDSLSVPADDSLTLGATTLWVELVGLNRALRPGDGFPATLVFANGRAVTVRFTVERMPVRRLGAALRG